MAYNAQHISTRIVILFLTAALLVPSVVKFSHALSHHEHDICFEKNQTHLHNIDFDCDFYKFKIQKQTSFLIHDYNLLSVENNNNIKSTYYSFLSAYQHLHFSLRGPPCNS